MGRVQKTHVLSMVELSGVEQRPALLFDAEHQCRVTEWLEFAVFCQSDLEEAERNIHELRQMEASSKTSRRTWTRTACLAEHNSQQQMLLEAKRQVARASDRNNRAQNMIRVEEALHDTKRLHTFHAHQRSMRKSRTVFHRYRSDRIKRHKRHIHVGDYEARGMAIKLDAKRQTAFNDWLELFLFEEIESEKLRESTNGESWPATCDESDLPYWGRRQAALQSLLDCVWRHFELVQAEAPSRSRYGSLDVAMPSAHSRHVVAESSRGSRLMKSMQKGLSYGSSISAELGSSLQYRDFKRRDQDPDGGLMVVRGRRYSGSLRRDTENLLSNYGPRYVRRSARIGSRIGVSNEKCYGSVLVSYISV